MSCTYKVSTFIIHESSLVGNIFGDITGSLYAVEIDSMKIFDIFLSFSDWQVWPTELEFYWGEDDLVQTHLSQGIIGAQTQLPRCQTGHRKHRSGSVNTNTDIQIFMMKSKLLYLIHTGTCTIVIRYFYFLKSCFNLYSDQCQFNENMIKYWCSRFYFLVIWC